MTSINIQRVIKMFTDRWSAKYTQVKTFARRAFRVISATGKGLLAVIEPKRAFRGGLTLFAYITLVAFSWLWVVLGVWAVLSFFGK